MFPQSAEQSEEGAVWEVVEDDSDTDDEDLGVVKAEDALVEGTVSEAIHRLPCLSPLSNVHADALVIEEADQASMFHLNPCN